ncbi:MAG: hypothetical protein ABIH25_04540 [Candidatus Woesearchaeota archaeon]
MATKYEVIRHGRNVIVEDNIVCPECDHVIDVKEFSPRNIGNNRFGILVTCSECYCIFAIYDDEIDNTGIVTTIDGKAKTVRNI